MTEMTNGMTVATTSEPKNRSAAKKRSAASSKRDSAPKKKRGKRGGKVPGHWSKTHAQLVLHATPELVKKLDRKLEALGKRLGCNPTRGAVVRALVERAIK